MLYMSQLPLYVSLSQTGTLPALRAFDFRPAAGIVFAAAITYSTKAVTHKNVHPYLRYGILIGRREHYPLPGRLIRHGANFDFMASWTGTDPTDDEWQALMNVLVDEVRASRKLEEILTNSRSAGRARYTIVHKPLKCEHA